MVKATYLAACGHCGQSMAHVCQSADQAMTDHAARVEALEATLRRIQRALPEVRRNIGDPDRLALADALEEDVAAALAVTAPWEATDQGADGEIREELGRWWAEEFSDITLPTEALIRLSERLATLRMFTTAEEEKG